MKTRVMHLTYDMRIGGTEQVIKNLVEGSDTDRYEMSIFCLEQPLGPFGEMLREQGIAIDAVARRPGFDTSLIRRIRRHLRQHNIDVLHCHQYTPWVYGALAAAGTGVRVIFTEHGRFYPDRRSWKRRYINPLLTRLTTHITAISKATRQALVDFEYLRGERIEVIYNGIIPLEPDPEGSARLKQALGLSPQTRVIGTIARLDPIKNHAMMFRAFKTVLGQHPDTVLLLVGDGELRDELESLVQSLQIQDNVIFTGYVSRPRHHLECMEIFLLPSFSEGTSMTLLEAMSLAKPCVVTDVGGNPEIISHRHNGLVTPSDDAARFAEAITHLLDSPDEVQKMKAQAKQRFLQLFTVEQMCNRFSSLYSGS